jgi:hypothetical protein
VPRLRSPKGYLALDLEPDGTFTLWVFDESEPYVRTWNIYEGQVSTSGLDRLVLRSTKMTRYADGDTNLDTTEFVVALSGGAPAAIEAFGDSLALVPELRPR